MKKRQGLYSGVILAMVCLVIHACEKETSFNYPAKAVSLYKIITEDNIHFSYMRFAVDRAGLADMLESDEYTLFSPTNSAFVQAGYDLQTLEEMQLDSLTALVENHLVAEKIDVSTLGGEQELTALSGEKIRFQAVGDFRYVDGGDITNENVHAVNGYLHVINKVLVNGKSIVDRLRAYSSSTADMGFTFFIEALAKASEGATDYISLLSDPAASYTLFAPNNGAFIDAGYNSLGAVTATPSEELMHIIERHMISGKVYTSEFDTLQPANSLIGTPVYVDRQRPKVHTDNYINSINSSRGRANMEAGGSIIHTVNRFLPTPLAASTIDVVQNNANLTLFYAAVVKASEAGNMDFLQMLSGSANTYTVFAVTNGGFLKAGYPNIEAINNENTETLSNLLRFHMLNQRINNINIPENGTVPTLLTVLDVNNEPTEALLTISSAGGYKVKGGSNVNTIPVVSGNIVTSNGLLNVIEELLTP